jgi:hypothetical protein
MVRRLSLTVERCLQGRQLGAVTATSSGMSWRRLEGGAHYLLLTRTTLSRLSSASLAISIWLCFRALCLWECQVLHLPGRLEAHVAWTSHVMLPQLEWEPTQLGNPACRESKAPLVTSAVRQRSCVSALFEVLSPCEVGHCVKHGSQTLKAVKLVTVTRRRVR